jgi:hypothetical protein
MDNTKPIQWLDDGSIRFRVDEDWHTWRPPKVRHVEKYRNAWSQIAENARAGIAQLTSSLANDQEADTSGIGETTRNEVAAIVLDMDRELALPSPTLNTDPLEWPNWLPRISFLTAVINHWMSNPFD